MTEPTDINAPAQQRYRHLPCLALLLLLAAAIYAQTLGFGFLTNWDDTIYVTQNRSIQEFSLRAVITQFTTTYQGNYAPLQMLSYMLDHAVWGLKPAGYHLSNLLLHAANGCLFYLLATAISNSRLAGLLAAAIFIAHPVQVETVAWISQRKTLLAMLFFLAAFLLYRQSRLDDRRQGALYLLSLGAFIAALLAKSAAVALPLCLLFHDLLIHGSGNRQTVRWQRLLPFGVIALCAAVTTIMTQSPELAGGRSGYHGGSPYATLLTMLPVTIRYLGMLLWPKHLSAVYLPEIKTAPDLVVAGSAALLAGFAAAAGALCRRKSLFCFWLLLFFTGLLPVCQLVPLVTLMNDRYLYFPLLGAAGLAGQAIALLVARRPAQRYLLCVVTLLPLLFLSVGSHRRAGVWRDSVSLWQDTSARYPNNRDIMAALAESYRQAGDGEAALAAYRQALSPGGEFADPRQELHAMEAAAALLLERSRYDDAEILLARLLQRFPGNPAALLRLGNLHLEQGRLEQAGDCFRAVLASGSDGPDLRVAMARLSMRTGSTKEALQHLAEARRQGLVNPARLRLVEEFLPLSEIDSFRRLSSDSD